VGKDEMIAREAKPIVVRTADIAYLEQCLETALTGERQVVFVSGEPGIGKTTIVDTFPVRSKNNAGLWFGHGQCVEQYGAGEAFMPLLEIAGQLCRGPSQDETRELLRRYALSWLVQLPFLIDTTEREALQQQLPGQRCRILDLLEAFRRRGAEPHRRKRGLDNVGGSYVRPLLARELVECHQPFPIVGEPLHGFGGYFPIASSELCS
jgi:hypothetical protein